MTRRLTIGLDSVSPVGSGWAENAAQSTDASEMRLFLDGAGDDEVVALDVAIEGIGGEIG